MVEMACYWIESKSILASWNWIPVKQEEVVSQ